jgi:hypothetical protein
MNVVRHARDAIRLTARIPCHGGEIRVELRARFLAQNRAAILRAENDVDDDETQGLGYGDIGSWPMIQFFPAGGNVLIEGPTARQYPSLGQRPRIRGPMIPQALKGRPIGSGM